MSGVGGYLRGLFPILEKRSEPRSLVRRNARLSTPLFRNEGEPKKEENEAKHAQTSLDSLVSDDMRPWVLRYR